MRHQTYVVVGNLLIGWVLVMGALPGAGKAQTTMRVSVVTGGGQGNALSVEQSISADGRFVAFDSFATNLVPDDTNGDWDVFVHDRQTGQTTRVSVSTGGGQGDDDSLFPSLSADGRFVTFSSNATTLVPGDTNGVTDIFVHDRQTGETTRVSVASGGTPGNSISLFSSLSADGRFVAFDSFATNLVPGDTNGDWDVFVHDRQTGQTTRASVSTGGGQGDGHSFDNSLSADGRFVAFDSLATNLTSSDTNAKEDIFVHDRQTGQTTLVSVATGGALGDDDSIFPSLSADGRFVAFSSTATTLVPDDSNGFPDIFFHDLQTGSTTRVSVASGGEPGNNISQFSSLSADGRYVAFASFADNLVPGDINVTDDVFVHDRQTGQTTLVSVSTGGAQGNSFSGVIFDSAIKAHPSISANGRFVAFPSLATNLVPDDTNGSIDIFVHDLGEAAVPPASLAPAVPPANLVPAVTPASIVTAVPPVSSPVQVGAAAVPPASLVAAVLPSSRSMQVGAMATAVGVLINSGTTTATSCSIAPSTSIPATFSYQTTDPITNVATGSPNTPVDIPAGGSQTFMFSLTSTAEIAPTEIHLNFTCTNTVSASSTVGLNTLLFSASMTPVPDIVALVGTPTNDGIIHLPGATGGIGSTGVFVVASVNVGATDAITVSVDTGNVNLPLAITMCQTDTATGVCLSPPSANVTTNIVANTTPSFGMFVEGVGAVPFDPATNRLFIRFTDQGGITRGSTSVAVQTP